MKSIWRNLLIALLTLCLIGSIAACTPTADPNKDPDESQSQEETTGGDSTTGEDATTGEDFTAGEDFTTGEDSTESGDTTEEATTVDGPGLELYPDDSEDGFSDVTKK